MIIIHWIIGNLSDSAIHVRDSDSRKFPSDPSARFPYVCCMLRYILDASYLLYASLTRVLVLLWGYLMMQLTEGIACHSSSQTSLLWAFYCLQAVMETWNETIAYNDAQAVKKYHIHMFCSFMFLCFTYYYWLSIMTRLRFRIIGHYSLIDSFILNTVLRYHKSITESYPFWSCWIKLKKDIIANTIQSRISHANIINCHVVALVSHLLLHTSNSLMCL